VRPPELRAALFQNRHERPLAEAPHTFLCLSCGSLEEFDSSTCCDADSFFLPPALLSAIDDLTVKLETSREEVVRGLLSVALTAIERGGLAAHTRGVVFLRELEEREAATAAPPPGPGPRGLVESSRGAEAKPA